MSNVVDIIRENIIGQSKIYEEKKGYNYYENHIKYVVKNALELAEKFGADLEAVELGALLHDSAAVYEYGPIEEYNVYGEKLADKMLSDESKVLLKDRYENIMKILFN